MASAELQRIKERSKSRKRVDDIFDSKNRSYVIHYSCQSFYEEKINSNRITSIAIRNLHSAQTKSWSIHKSAELKGILESVNENLDELEKDMLQGFFDFMEKHSDCSFIHWNMRDENFGFPALEHRFRVLGGQPFELKDDNKFDLARELIAIYGRQYAPHTSPSGRKGRLMSIIELNKIADVDALQGGQEAEAFNNGEYLKLHQSTLRKVDIMANIFDRLHSGSLKTKASFFDKYGIHPVALIEVAKGHPISTGFILIGGIVGAFVNFEKFYHLFT